ncbi:hypothetical protein G7Z17_g5291 [Cylindrodendrum hubeiense]|uniref:DUF7600 domain-containing protein n=1 Tax=Cylindrodendrum hubeiense TaxID=595255 RepID=A0A9P5HB68_9HYPO|nr:hypothetical protein G7Z17_g5291 [Cylindrodendrum hubeiense]
MAVAVLADNGALSSWVGEHEDVPKQCLGDDRGTISALKGEFDAFKLLSLSISTSAMNSRGTDGGFPLRNACLWIPDVPPKHFLLSSASDETKVIAYANINAPLSPVVFGGPDGKDLFKLVEVLVWVYDVGIITGFEFVYTDSSRRSFGMLGPFSGGMSSLPPERQRVALRIDGPGGERIESIQIQRRDTNQPREGGIVATTSGYSGPFMEPD